MPLRCGTSAVAAGPTQPSPASSRSLSRPGMPHARSPLPPCRLLPTAGPSAQLHSPAEPPPERAGARHRQLLAAGRLGAPSICWVEWGGPGLVQPGAALCRHIQRNNRRAAERASERASGLHRSSRQQGQPHAPPASLLASSCPAPSLPPPPPRPHPFAHQPASSPTQRLPLPPLAPHPTHLTPPSSLVCRAADNLGDAAGVGC